MIRNIVLIYADIRNGDQGEFSFGISILSAVLKREGYNVSLLHMLHDISREEFLKIPELQTCDLVGISYLTFGKDVVEKWPAWIKELKDVPIIMGGIHATLNPDEVIHIKGVDMLIIGEADLSFPLLIGALNGKRERSSVPGLWYKDNGTVVKNEEKAVVQDLDELPFLDTEIFDFDNLVSSAGRLPYLPYITSRGCPFNCSYCSNHYLRTLHPCGKKYLRRQSVDRVIEEVKFLLDKHPDLKTVSFIDDMFNFDTAWLKDFAEKYPREIGLPFRVLVRIDALTPEHAALLKKAGCFRATFGLESGDPNIRYNIMNRKMKDETIITGVGYLKDQGIHVVSYNMVGLPEETNQTMLRTVKLNVRCGVDIAFCSIFQPHPNTKLYELCKERGFLSDRHYRSVYEGSTLDMPGITEVDIKFAHRAFRFFIEAYKRIWKFPGPFKIIFEKALDAAFFAPQFFKKLMIFVHDKCFNGTIIDHQYRSAEKDMMKSQAWREIRQEKLCAV